jgi:hypothetical protein
MLVFFGKLILGIGLLSLWSTVVDCKDHGECRQRDDIIQQPRRTVSNLRWMWSVPTELSNDIDTFSQLCYTFGWNKFMGVKGSQNFSRVIWPECSRQHSVVHSYSMSFASMVVVDWEMRKQQLGAVENSAFKSEERLCSSHRISSQVCLYDLPSFLQFLLN